MEACKYYDLNFFIYEKNVLFEVVDYFNVTYLLFVEYFLKFKFLIKIIVVHFWAILNIILSNQLGLFRLYGMQYPHLMKPPPPNTTTE